MTKPEPPQPIAWEDGRVRFLDQTLLPLQEISVATARSDEVVEAIKRLSIRGAPLIGIAAAYAVVLAWRESRGDRDQFERSLRVIEHARPTAVNLRYSVQRMRTVVAQRMLGESDTDAVGDALLSEAKSIHQQEQRSCEAIASNGAPLLSGTDRVLTICNTGSLATGGRGTALAMIDEAVQRGFVGHVYALETRPLLQGARLTMWELGKRGIPSTLIPDSSAGWLLASGRIGAVIAGADRIARNGDTANKIGTYTLSVLAQHHGVPFYIAAPWSTVDLDTGTGSEITIEMRDPDEVTSFAGTRTTPEGADAVSPAFDVTPASNIRAIVTDRAVLSPPLDVSIGRMIPESGTR